MLFVPCLTSTCTGPQRSGRAYDAFKTSHFTPSTSQHRHFRPKTLQRLQHRKFVPTGISDFILHFNWANKTLLRPNDLSDRVETWYTTQSHRGVTREPPTSAIQPLQHLVSANSSSAASNNINRPSTHCYATIIAQGRSETVGTRSSTSAATTSSTRRRQPRLQHVVNVSTASAARTSCCCFFSTHRRRILIVEQLNIILDAIHAFPSVSTAAAARSRQQHPQQHPLKTTSARSIRELQNR